jgi:hypothetical protein
VSDEQGEIDASRPTEWSMEGPIGPEAIRDMVETLGGAGLVVPEVPNRLRDRVMTGGGWAWGTDPSIAPFVAYFGFEWMGQSLTKALEPARDDFWMWAHRGHGQNSYGAGVVARVGPIVLAQQTLFGGLYTNGPASTQQLSAANEIWNRTLESLGDLEGPPRVVVLWSNYRGWSTILASGEVEEPSDPAGSRARESQKYEVPEGWRVLVAGRSEEALARLDELVDHDDEAVAIAAKHLDALIKSTIRSS